MLIKEFCQKYTTGELSETPENPEEIGWFNYACSKDALAFHHISIYEILSEVHNPVIKNSALTLINYINEENHVCNIIGIEITNAIFLAVDIDLEGDPLNLEHPKYTVWLYVGTEKERAIICPDKRYVIAMLNGVRPNDKFAQAIENYKLENTKIQKETEARKQELEQILKNIDDKIAAKEARIKDLEHQIDIIEEEEWIRQHNKTKYM